jgi:hypothetical protein
MGLCAFTEPQITELINVIHFAPYVRLLLRVNSVSLACLGNIILSLPEEGIRE